MGENNLVDLYLIKETEEKVKLIRDRLKAALNRQKSYVDLKRKDIDYNVGEKIFLKVSPWKKTSPIWEEGEAESKVHWVV